MKQCNFLAVLTILVVTISGVLTSNVSCTARGSGLAGGIPLSNTSFVIYLFGDTSTVFSGFAANISVWLTSQQSNLVLEPHLYQYLPSIVDNNDGSYTVTYAVIAYGTFFLHVNFNSIGIKNSPFRAEFTAAQYPCANDCNNHGLCHANGSCLCYPGYTTNTCSIAVVPTCYQAKISPCGTSMFLYFMPAVNTSASTASCQYILDVESLTKLGSNPQCIWKNATTLNTVFGSGATMMPGDTIIVSSPTTNFQSARLAETSLVVVESPLMGTSVAPVSVISAPSTHNPCSDLVLDATSSYNSGGRPMLYAWGVYSSSTVDIIKNFLSTVTTSVAVIPFKYTSQVGFGHDLIFILNITNYLGITTTASVPVRFSGIQTIDVRVTPAIIYVDAGQAVDIAGLVSFPSGECSGVQSLKKIKYSWIRKSGPLIELRDATNARLLHINKGVLAPGQLYEFELLVSSEVASGAAVAVVHVAEPAPFIYIVGGTRLFPFGEDLFLQAEVIVNGNNVSLARIVWSVMDTVSKIIVAKDLESFGSITIAASLFYPGKFRVVASLMTASDNLVAEDAVEIHITESSETPIVFIKAPFTVPAGEHLILSAVVASHTQEFTYVWASPQLDLQNREHSITPYNSQLLVVNGASLAFGSTMTFSVIAVSNKTQQIGWAQVEVVIGNALSSGACSLGSSGLAFRDIFGLACLGWETTAHPLTVKTWRQFEDSTKIPLQLTHDPISSVNFVLPAGAHTILANIQDSAGNSLWISLNTSAAYSTYDQSVLSQNPMLLVNSLLTEMQMNIGNYDVLIQNLPGIIDVLNFASTVANPASNTARMNARETICNMSVGLLQAKESISGLVSYMLTQIAVFPSELSNTALLQMRQYMETIAAPSFYLDRSSLQLHLKAIYSYILAELDNGAVSPVFSVATTALNALSQASLVSVFPAQDPFILSHNGLQLCVAKGISAGNLTAAGVNIFVSNQWELSIVSWPFNLYPDTSVSTIVKAITYNDNTPNPANADIVLPLLRNVADINGTIVECNAWNATTMSWSNNTCKLINISPIVCRCVLYGPTTVVSAFVYSGDSNVIAIPPDTLDIVKFSMLSEYQWAIIIGVGITAVGTLIGAVALAGKRSRYTNSFIRLREYNGVLRMDSEEPDVTIEDLSTITGDLSDTGSNFEGDSTQSEEEVTLSEAEELGKAPNSTRLSRMGVQEGATGYVVSSTTLRNTVETDYDLEMKENIGPIKGTALRIRAHSIDMNQNIPGTPPPNPPNFNTASRVSLTAARAKLSAPSISRSALGFTRGDSLRAIPTTWKTPQN